LEKQIYFLRGLKKGAKVIQLYLLNMV